MLDKVNSLLSTISPEKYKNKIISNIENLKDRLFNITLSVYQNITFSKKLYFNINNEMDTRIKVPIDFDYSDVLYNSSLDENEQKEIMNKLDNFEKEWKAKKQDEIQNFSDSINAIIYKFTQNLKESYDNEIIAAINGNKTNINASTNMIKASDISESEIFRINMYAYGNKLSINSSSNIRDVKILNYDKMSYKIIEKFEEEGINHKDIMNKLKQINKEELYDIGSKNKQISLAVSNFIKVYINNEIELYNESVKKIGEKYGVEYR